MNDDFRNQVFHTFNQKETDTLIRIWQKNDRSAWSDTAFDVIQEILQNRLGKLPLQVAPGEKSSEPEYEGLIENDEIRELAENGDVDGLVEILEREADPFDPLDPFLWLEAASALARLGDKRGLDYLISALEIPDSDVNLAAKNYLIELNHPEGNRAMQAMQANQTQIRVPGTSETLNAKYPYLTAYIGFIALQTLVSFVIGFVPLPSLIQLGISLILGFFIFKFVVHTNVLRYVSLHDDNQRGNH